MKFQVEKSWHDNGRKEGLQGLDQMAKKSINWEDLDNLNEQGKVTIFGKPPRESS